MNTHFYVIAQWTVLVLLHMHIRKTAPNAQMSDIWLSTIEGLTEGLG